MLSFQEVITRLNHFWASKGCLLQQGCDLEVGAGTFNPETFLRALGPEPYSVCFVEPSRRPTDGRYGENPNRLQKYFQYQVIIKPSPKEIRHFYLESLVYLGIDLNCHDIRFVHDDWQSPTLGAWGLGWEVWIDGMEITQFTYFQQMGSIDLNPISVEITYGLERLAMYLQEVDSVYDLQYNDQVTYGEIYQKNEYEFSKYYFTLASKERHLTLFDFFKQEALENIEHKLPLVAYDMVIKCSHLFNVLEARGAISVIERVSYIDVIRNLAKKVAKLYLIEREKMGFPLLKNNN